MVFLKIVQGFAWRLSGSKQLIYSKALFCGTKHKLRTAIYLRQTLNFP